MSALHLTEAVNMFVMTQFEQCFNECNTLIKTAKCEPEQERNHKLIEAATALGIQALAETDTWYCVMAFITDVYSNVALCPPTIIQLCILLHAQVKEYLPCHRVVETWLKNPQNQKHKQYSQVIRTYAYHILCPTGSYDLLKEIAEKCDALTQAERAALLQLSQTKRLEESRCFGNEKDCSTLPDTSASNTLGSARKNSELRQIQGTILPDTKEQGCENGSIRCNSNETNSENRADLSTFQTALNWLYKMVRTKLNCFRHPRFSLVLMGMLAVWALIQTQTGDPVSSLGHFVILWKAFLQKLGSLSSNN